MVFDLPSQAGIPNVRRMRLSSLLLFGLIHGWQPAGAVVVVPSGPNITAPFGQPYFGNVGALNGASAIYLGDGWVLSADHVAGSLPGSVNFGGVSYSTQAGTFHRLGNPASSPTLSLQTDMVVFRLIAPPVLPGIDISSATPTVGSQVMMIGNGRRQAGALTYWDRTENTGDGNDTWVETTEALSNISGFQTTGTHEVSWGENVVDANRFTVDIGLGDVISFSTRFDAAGLAQEAQAVSGDSGGAVFSYNGSSWELSGMIYAVSTYETQPGGTDTAVFGTQTAIADLSYYRAEIFSIVPEPSAALLGMFGGLVLIRRRR